MLTGVGKDVLTGVGMDVLTGVGKGPSGMLPSALNTFFDTYVMPPSPPLLLTPLGMLPSVLNTFFDTYVMPIAFYFICQVCVFACVCGEEGGGGEGNKGGVGRGGPVHSLGVCVVEGRGGSTVRLHEVCVCGGGRGRTVPLPFT